MTQHLLIFGFGYSASYFARAYGHEWQISATVRDAGKAEILNKQGIPTFIFNPDYVDAGLRGMIARADALLISIPPAQDDPVLRVFGEEIIAHPPKRIVYLSTIGVYGDHAGAWVDETTPPHPKSLRSQQRLRAEQQWQSLSERAQCALDILRLAGIYGPHQNALEQLRRNSAKHILKKGQVFNRIHVADIAQVIHACLTLRHEGGVWNVGDNEPAPPQDVVSYAVDLLGCTPPPLIDFDAADLSPMARSFYGENKRVRNEALRTTLGIKLIYPTYREGLQALYDSLRQPEAGDD